MTVLDAFDLSGRVAVVTGATRGLGRAFAQALAEAGADVAVLSRDGEACEQVAGEVRCNVGVDAAGFEVDVTDADAMTGVAAAVHDRLGPVDVLVNNAGTCVHRPALGVTAAEWRQVMDTNVDGVWHGCQVFGRGMVDRGSGVIVNVGSMSGAIVNRPQWQPAYNTS